MINYTAKLDKAIRRSAWAHEQAGQHRKGTDLPYIIHPFGTMLIASNATKNEDILIACLLHDILEDINPKIYGESEIESEFGSKILSIVKDVTNNNNPNWYQKSEAYLNHIAAKACNEAIVVCISDKIHNLSSVLYDFEIIGDKIWQRFSTKNAKDQVWWYQSVLEVTKKRGAPKVLVNQLEALIEKLLTKVSI